MRVVVRVLEFLLVDVRVRVSLSVVTVLVLVLDVVMIVQDVRVRMHHVAVRVVMGVLCRGHSLLRFDCIRSRPPTTVYEWIGPVANRCYAEQGLPSNVSYHAN